MENNGFGRLVDLLTNEKEVREKLLAMSPAEATEALKKLGYNFSEAEIIEFSNTAKKSLQETATSEVKEEDLAQVAGGKGKTDWNAVGAGMVFGAAATALGYAALVSICMW